MHSYPRISVSVFVFDLKCGKKCHPNPIPYESDPFSFVVTALGWQFYPRRGYPWISDPSGENTGIKFYPWYGYEYKILLVDKVRIKILIRVGYPKYYKWSSKFISISNFISYIFCWLYEHYRLIIKLFELIDVKITLIFYLLFLVKWMHHCCIFRWNTYLELTVFIYIQSTKYMLTIRKNGTGWTV